MQKSSRARARTLRRGAAGGSEQLIKVKQCETAPPRRTCAAAAARQGGKAGLGLPCTLQVTSQSDLIADVDAGSSARLGSFYFSPPSPWSRGWLLTSAATHGNRGCCFQTNVSAIIAPPAIFRRGGEKKAALRLRVGYIPNCADFYMRIRLSSYGVARYTIISVFLNDSFALCTMNNPQSPVTYNNRPPSLHRQLNR